MDSEAILDTLQRIERHLDSLVRMQFATTIKNVFADDVERKTFELTGEKSSTEICKDLRMSPNRLSELRAKWMEAGLIVKSGKGFKKVVD